MILLLLIIKAQLKVCSILESIYGTQAQDVLKPSYEIEEYTAAIQVDRDTILNPENFFDKLPATSKVNYTYGMRIVGGSRVHLILAIEAIYEAFGTRARITGGDTDSMKISCDKDITDEMLEAALAPLAEASKAAIDKTQRRVRANFPTLASDLANVGAFEIENPNNHYCYHMESWNKARVSVDADNHSHITCAGVSRPHNQYHIETFIDEQLKTKTPEEVLPAVLGYNVIIAPEISHSLQRTTPAFDDVFSGFVTDYLSNTTYVEAPEAVALYPCSRQLGETDIPANAENVAYMHDVYSRDVDTTERQLLFINGKGVLDYAEY